MGLKPPWKKAGTHVKRGVVQHHDPTVYFPYDFLSCQNEEGEVTEHTFTWPFYPEGQVFWWRCGGRSGGLLPTWSASRSPFWNAKCGEPLPEDTVRCPSLANNIYLSKWQSESGSDTPPDYVYSQNNALQCFVNRGNNLQYDNSNPPYNVWRIRRHYARFDTSGIPADAEIISATIRVYLAGGFIGDPTPESWRGGDLHIVKCDDPPDPWACDLARWNHLSTLDQTIAVVTMPVPSVGYYTYPLNDAGLAHLNKDGITNIAGRCANDILRTSMPDLYGGIMGSILYPLVLSYIDVTYRSPTP